MLYVYALRKRTRNCVGDSVGRAARLFPLIEQVNDDQEVMEIVSKKGTAFLVPEDEYRSLRETAYLLQSPANAERLHRSVDDARAGRATVHELLDAE